MIDPESPRENEPTLMPPSASSTSPASMCLRSSSVDTSAKSTSICAVIVHWTSKKTSHALMSPSGSASADGRRGQTATSSTPHMVSYASGFSGVPRTKLMCRESGRNELNHR
eukprot:Amastigsp_a850495_4.p2 type:complete len:112 gc:universal Amastigsp_a850495_4:427-92(-)